MQTPMFTAGGLTYQAIEICYSARACPPELAAWAQWSVLVLPDVGRAEKIAGWLAPDGPRRRGLTGTGNIRCYLGGAYQNPSYLTNVRSSRQGVRRIAEAHQAWLARQARPRRSRRAQQMEQVVDTFFHGGGIPR